MFFGAMAQINILKNVKTLIRQVRQYGTPQCSGSLIQELESTLQNAIVGRTPLKYVNIDNLAVALLPDDTTFCQTQEVPGDGNCLFNSVSIYISGDTSHARLLRALVAFELARNADLYANHPILQSTIEEGNIFTDHEDTLFSLLLTDEASDCFDANRERVLAIKKEAELTCDDHRWSSMIHMLALATVVKATIVSVYPNANEGIRPLFNRHIKPLCGAINTCHHEEIGILWSRDGNLDNRQGFSYEPNHFVLLLSEDSLHRKDVEANIPMDEHMTSPTDTDNLTQEPLPSEEHRTFMQSKPHPTLDDSSQQSADSERLTSAIVDVGNVLRGNSNSITDADRYKYLKFHFVPCKTSTCLLKQTLTKGKKQQRYTLTFQTSWFEKYPWLVFSPSQQGGLCKFCILFPPTTNRVKNAVFVTRPFVNLAKAYGKDGQLENHAGCKYHAEAVAKGAAFLDTYNHPERDVRYQLLQSSEQTLKENRHILERIIKAIHLCGKQNIALRGHRDDQTSAAENKGNFLAILELIAENDEILKNHLSDSRRNARYTSKTVQNEFIQLLGDNIRNEITQGLREDSSVYSIIADEVTDISNKEILSLCIRFVVLSPEIRISEIFLDFVHLDGITGQTIAKSILDTLQKHNIDVTKCRGQCYDGASAMSSERVGVQRRIREHSESAVYTHCNSHVLNLSIASSCKLPLIRNMMDCVNELFLFFSNSPKRQRMFECIIGHVTPSSKVKRLKGLCKTRWVERHLCFDTLFDLYESALSAMEYILDPTSFDIEGDIPTDWDRETRVKAQGLLSSLKSPSFLMAFIIVKNTLQIIKPLTVKLQKRDMDIACAFGMIDATKAEINDLLGRIGDGEFLLWFEEAAEMASVASTTISMPRLAGRQSHRANVQSSTSEEYFLRNLAIPFIDYLVSEVNLRFKDNGRSGRALFSLLPKAIIKVDDVNDVVAGVSLWHNDLPSPSSLRFELTSWKRKWSSTIENQTDFALDNLVECLNVTDVDIFPNIHRLLVIGCTLPITSCEAERSFSVHRRTKTYLRTTMSEERLSGLALMNIYPGVVIDYETVVKQFIQMHPRRIDV